MTKVAFELSDVKHSCERCKTAWRRQRRANTNACLQRRHSGGKDLLANLGCGECVLTERQSIARNDCCWSTVSFSRGK